MFPIFAPKMRLCSHFTPTEKFAASWRSAGACSRSESISLRSPNASIEAAEKYLHEKNLTKPGDQLVIISDILAEGSRFDCVQLRTAK